MKMNNSLVSTVWGDKMHAIFGVVDDVQLCSWMTTIGLIYTAVIGVYSIFCPAPYGRYAKPYFGPTVNPKLAWMVQECPAFFIPLFLIVTTPGQQLSNVFNIIGISLFMVHYFHRSFIFPFALAPQAKPAPVATMLSAVVFCGYNGFLQGHHLLNTSTVSSSPLAVLIGVPVFFLGMYINARSDRMLIALRKESKKDAQGKTEYKIPRGFLFEYISGANYFGEIVEWWGFALVTQGYPQIAFAVFSSVFLGLRATHHHSFYKSSFGDAYPSSRKAVIPFIL